jgi:hypothetical protein
LQYQSHGLKKQKSSFTMAVRSLEKVFRKAGKTAMGVVMIALAAMILSGADKPIESWLVDHSPTWLTQLTTLF